MKILIIGAAYQGKLEYAKKVFMHKEITIEALHKSVLHLMRLNQNPWELLRDLSPMENWLVICNEIGGGIVPADAALRDYRECVGKLCCEIAAQADVVIHMTCGIPQIIKGSI